jgi:acyl-CoA synthetase (NDP forming)
VVTLVREERFFETLPEVREAVADASSAIVYYSYTRGSPASIAALAELGIPCFSTPARAGRALQAAVEYAEFLRRADSLAVFASDRPAPLRWTSPAGPLSEAGARAYLAPLRIPSPEDRIARSTDEAVAAFHSLGGGAVALKVQSPELPHKTDVGGVRLGLRTAEEVGAAFDAMLLNVRQARPDASIEGVLVQQMARDYGLEVFVAARRQPLLGPLVVVGLGGVEVEATADITMRLAPVSLTEAYAMIQELRGAALLRRTRGRPAADVDALADAIVRFSELAVGLPANVKNVELNPLLVREAGQGVLMLDAAIELEDQGGGSAC